MKTNQHLSVLLSLGVVFDVMAAPDPPSVFHHQVKIVNGNDQPLPGATVELYLTSDLREVDTAPPPVFARATANESGTVTFTVTNQTAYTILARKLGQSLGWVQWYPQPDQEDGPSVLALTAPTALSGVVNDAGGKPIPDAEVWVTLARIPSKWGGSLRVPPSQVLRGRGIMTTRTASDGTFRFGQLPAETALDLAANKPGLALVRQTAKVAGPVLRYKAGESNIVLTLKPTGDVEGLVVEEDTGKPVAGARVSSARTDRSANPISSLPTGANGAFRVANLAEGDADLRATIGTNQFPEWVCEPVTASVTAGATNRNIKISASRGGVIEITVRNSAGQPVKDAAVSVTSQNKSGAAQTSEAGVARLRVPPGEYSLYVPNPGGPAFQSRITCEKGETNSEDVILEQAKMITGTVLDPEGKPAPKVRIRVFPFGKEKLADNQGRFSVALESARMGAFGNIQTVIIFRDLARNLVGTLDADEGITNVSVRLEPGLTLFGRVTDTGGRTVTNADFQMFLDTERVGGVLGQPIAAEADGRFEARALLPGRHYEITVTAKGYGMETRNLGSVDPEARKLELDPFQLPVADRRVAGIVVDTEDKPVAGVRVSSYGPGQARINGQTDSQGRFLFDQVCAGPIKLSAMASNGQGDVAAEGGDTNITLKLGMTQSEQSTPMTGAKSKLSGTVMDPEGKPASQVLVSLFPYAENEKPTDNQGRFTLTPDPDRIGNSRPAHRVVVARDPARNLAVAIDLDKGVTNAELKLGPGWTVMGRVVDANGAAIPNARVQATFKMEPTISDFGSPTRVDAQGRFEIKALPLERSFSMVFTAKGFGHDTCTVEPPEGEPKRVEMEPVHLPAADQQIAGVVLDPDDKPVRGANLYSIGDNKQPVTRGQTDSKGRFHFKQVCAGPMQIFVNSQNGLNGNATVEGGDTNIIIHISTPVGMRAKVASVSLQGKPLPDLAPLGLTATDAPANQRVLAVLIDAEQRPSKRVLKRITDLADPLKEKGVSVVVLHAGTLDGAAFDAWKKEAALPFPIGVFKGNREKTRAAWGTASLPWLVLTDANHQVTDEGFAAGELDEKLNLTGK